MKTLVYVATCRCAGAGCGGHVPLSQVVLDELDMMPIGWQGPAQHTYTASCDGFHPPGPCRCAPSQEVKP